MTMSAKVEVRCTDIEKESWTRAAGEQGVSAWLRQLANLAAEQGTHGRAIIATPAVELPQPKTTPKTREPTPKKKLSRTTMCEHRIPAHSHCRHCD